MGTTRRTVLAAAALAGSTLLGACASPTAPADSTTVAPDAAAVLTYEAALPANDAESESLLNTVMGIYGRSWDPLETTQAQCVFENGDLGWRHMRSTLGNADGPEFEAGILAAKAELDALGWATTFTTDGEPATNWYIEATAPDSNLRVSFGVNGLEHAYANTLSDCLPE